MLDLWIVENFGDRVDWRIGNLICIEARQPVLSRSATKLLAQNLNDFVMAIGA